MQQVYWITSSRTWTCPKAGAWKIVCVGGGASGGIGVKIGAKALQSAGGTTSFGSLLSASGGAIETCCANYSSACGGYGGFDGMNYGGTPQMGSNTDQLSPSSGNGGILGRPGLGYGAGGGIVLVGNISVNNNGTTVNQKTYSVPGRCGSMTMGIFDLTLNQNISCTVGTSSKPSITASTLLQELKNNGIAATEVKAESATQISKYITAGTAGVIYIEFLG